MICVSLTIIAALGVTEATGVACDDDGIVPPPRREPALIGVAIIPIRYADPSSGVYCDKPELYKTLARPPPVIAASARVACIRGAIRITYMDRLIAHGPVLTFWRENMDLIGHTLRRLRDESVRPTLAIFADRLKFCHALNTNEAAILLLARSDVDLTDPNHLVIDPYTENDYYSDMIHSVILRAAMNHYDETMKTDGVSVPGVFTTVYFADAFNCTVGGNNDRVLTSAEVMAIMCGRTDVRYVRYGDTDIEAWQMYPAPRVPGAEKQEA